MVLVVRFDNSGVASLSMLESIECIASRHSNRRLESSFCFLDSSNPIVKAAMTLIHINYVYKTCMHACILPAAVCSVQNPLVLPALHL